MNTKDVYFDPVDFSFEECAWLLNHLGEPWVVASRTINPVRNLAADPRKDKNPIIYPDGVNPNAVKPVIDKVAELEQLRTHENVSWVGIDTIKNVIQVYLNQAKRWQTDKRKGAPRFPSLSSYDTKGRPHFSGPGSDTGKVKTYFAEDGSRKEFRVEWVPTGIGTWVADWAEKAAEMDQPVKGLVVNKDLARIECFCGHTEKFKTESRASFNAARARISKHLRQDSNPEFVEQHRTIHTDEFGGR